MKRRFALHLWRPGFTVAVLALAVSSVLQGASITVASWSGSALDRRWGDASFNSLTLANSLTQGVNYNSNYSISSGLSGLKTFVIEEAATTMSSGDINTLKTWVQNGGVLLLFVDPNQVVGGSSNLFVTQNILANLGSSINVDLSGSSYGSANGANASLAQGLTTATPGFFAVNNNSGIGGQSLAKFNGITISGGNTIGSGDLANLIRTDKIGTGTIFVFGDRFDHNYQFGSGCGLSIAACGTNQQLFANIMLGLQSDPIPVGAPEPGSWALMATGLAGLLYFGRNRFSRRG